MADGDDPTSTNYELRMMGLRGDDEDDLEDGRAELLGTMTEPPNLYKIKYGCPC